MCNLGIREWDDNTTASSGLSYEKSGKEYRGFPEVPRQGGFNEV
jgi:hypothetical protein